VWTNDYAAHIGADVISFFGGGGDKGRPDGGLFFTVEDTRTEGIGVGTGGAGTEAGLVEGLQTPRAWVLATSHYSSAHPERGQL